jgi:hypothetical protein
VWNTLPDAEEVFFISTPSAGLWSTREKIEGISQSKQEWHSTGMFSSPACP